MTGPIAGRYTVRCASCQATVYSSDTVPPADRQTLLTGFADTSCPRGGDPVCPNTTTAQEAAAERHPARLVTRLREAWDQIQQWAERGQQTITELRALEARQPRTVVAALPALPAGRHDIPITWPSELPVVPRVQVTPETPRAGVGAIRVAVLAGSRTTTGCVVVIDTSVAVSEGQAWLHVTATP